MINILHFYEAGKARSGTALFPLLASPRIDIMISTRNYNISIDFGNGNITNYTTPKLHDYAVLEVSPAINHTYSTDFTGDVKVKAPQGLADVYSLCTSYGGFDAIFNIPDLELFLKQFPKLYSYRFHQHNFTETSKVAIIKGDFAKSPKYIKRIYVSALDVVNNTTDILINISNFPNDSELIFFEQGNIGSLKTTGDISKIPTSTSFFKISSVVSGSSITYTAGKVWASSFDTLSIPLVLTTAELDNLLIDMNNSITTKIGAGVIYLGGWRSSISDSAVASLQAKGFTVGVKAKHVLLDSSVIFRMDFQNNYDIYSSSLIDISSGNGVGSLGNLPTFALSGRKAGEYCAVFNGSQSIKTATNLPINSDKVTVEFGMKTTQTTLAILLELSENMNANNSFGFWTNNGASNTVDGLSRNSNYNTVRAALTHNGGWNHIAMVVDRAENATNEVKLYINGNLATVTKPFSTDNIGDFINKILYIGQRAGNTLGFNGALMYLKAYNFAKTAGEVSTANAEFVALGAGTPPPPPPPPTGQKVALIGDSTITSYGCRTQTIASILFNPAEITSGWEAVNLAVGGHTINNQLTVWNGHANKATYDIIIIQVGLNDMNTAISTTLTNYQNLINQINATKKVGAKVYISCMLPCKQRWTDLGWANGQTNWVALNNAIMDSTFTGVDKRNNAHVALLDDGNGNLAAAYDCGDHIHENAAGGEIIKNAFRAMIF